MIKIGKTTKTLTKKQNFYKILLDHPAKSSPIVVAIGPAGSCKTLIACNSGINKFLKKEVKKLIITRPTVLTEEIGYLPGDVNTKMSPFTRPIYDFILEHISSASLNSYLKNGDIEICPLSHMRGRTFNNSFLILDEAQNTSKSQMKTLLTRIGENCKIAINGDMDQIDIIARDSGLSDLLARCETHFEKSDECCISVVTLGEDDIVRSKFVKQILELYK